MIQPFPHQGLIKVSGPQSKPFLQGQLTCDLNEITPEHSLLGAYCDHKGRILTDFRLHYDGQDYYLLLNKSLLEKTITRLKKYAVFSKVNIDDCTHQPSTQAATEAWRLGNIMAGIPTIYPQTSELFTPHMINFHLIKGVSFNKGCFVGQEVIARTEHLGKSKRHMYRLQGVSDKRPEPGDPVFSQGQEVGTVVDASPDPELPSGYQLLAVIHDEKFIAQGVSLTPQGATLSLQTLPYTI